MLLGAPCLAWQQRMCVSCNMLEPTLTFSRGEYTIFVFMKRVFMPIVVGLVLLLVPSVLGHVEAAKLEFDKTEISVSAGSTFTVQVVIDSGNDEVTSSDVYVVFDNTILAADQITAGPYFPTVLEDIVAGRVYMAALVDDTTDYRSGKGTIATITFTALKDGVANITFRCSSTVIDTSKIIKNDTNSTDIISCASNGQMQVTVGAGAPTSVPTVPGVSPSPTVTPGVRPIITQPPSTGGIGGPIAPTSGATPSARPSELPASGIFENVLKAVIPGAVFLVFGILLKVFLRL